MVISQTPLRISFFGGGTDFKDYYELHEGMVVSATIDKFIYIVVKPRCLDDDIVLNYNEYERVQDVNEIKHDIFREVLKITGVTKGIEITSIADVPLQGTGLASSSALTVGLLNALFAYKGIFLNPHELAELACHVEIDLLGEPIGKQDQYAVAFGGLNSYLFKKDQSVEVKSLEIAQEGYRALAQHMHLFHTGIVRKASTVLSDQKSKIERNNAYLGALKDIAERGREHLIKLDINKVGKLLQQSWEEKKKLSDKIHNQEINCIFDFAMEAGAIGGKLLGAGAGGFFLFVCDPTKYRDLAFRLKDYQELSFTFEPQGSRIILNTKMKYAS